jgi:hypothetical protein
MKRDVVQTSAELENLVTLYEDGYKEIQSILGDGELTTEEQLDNIADIVFDDHDEED